MLLIVLLIVRLLEIYTWIIIISAILSWLVAFGVVNTRNRGVYKVLQFLDRITKPVFDQVRRVVPPMNGIDFSPIVVIIAIMLLQRLLLSLVM